MKEYDIIIIGAGPAGMSAAIASAASEKRILLLEGGPQIGKKILVTGNGRCNLTNEIQRQDCYRSDNQERAAQILSQFNYEKTFEFFHDLGILTRSKNGYIYPYNEQAASVREAFEKKLLGYDNITIRTDSHVDAVTDFRGGYRVHVGKERYSGRRLIITTGGYAGPKVGCDGSGYDFAASLGHSIVATFPALTSLKSSAPFLKKVAGVRNQAKISLLIDQKCAATESGELQWTDYGLSGVAVFQLSRFAILALSEGRRVSLSLDLMPDYDRESVGNIITDFCHTCPYQNISDILVSILPAKLVPIILRESKVEADRKAAAMDGHAIDRITDSMKSFHLRINGYTGYEKAQVTRGGVSLDELSLSLESIYHKGLFFAGEVLDVDGSCGGYNLQWAFSSGNIAGKEAALK